MINVNVSVKSIKSCKKDYSWNPSTCICSNSRYLKSATNSASKNVTNTLSTNVTSIASQNSDDKKVRCKMDCYILHTFLLVNILLFIIAIICCHYTKHRSKQKNIDTLTI